MYTLDLAVTTVRVHFFSHEISFMTSEMLVIGRLANRWHTPIIAHMSGAEQLSDRVEFPTLGSVALTSATEMARATYTFLSLNNWDQVTVV